MKESTVVIEVTHLHKVFKDFWGRPKVHAVNDVSFTVRSGTVFGLLGPNGSGKSTTIKMLLALLHPTAGEVKLFGAAPQSDAVRRRIGYLPEETFLHKHMSTQETLIFHGALYDLPAAECARRASDLMEMVGLHTVAKRPVGEFSKGMARRLGLAQALINDPDLLILDEPTSGLDPIGCAEVKRLIRSFCERGKTVLITSHLLADMEDLVDGVVVMYGGHVRAQGALSTLLADPLRRRLELPDPGPDLQERIMRLLAEAGVSAQDCNWTNPRQDLESYFLQIVRQARGESIGSTGAEVGQSLAAFLTPPPPPVQAATSVDLQRLGALAAAEQLDPAGQGRQEKAPENLSEANDKLSRLLSGSKPHE